jgi:hypothetical protein
MLTPEENDFVFDGEIFQKRNKNLLIVNDIDLSLYITSLTVDYFDITTADSGRQDNGEMYTDYVAKNLKKVNVQWEYCPSSYINTIKNAISSDRFIVQCVDDDGISYEAFEAYVGDRKSTLAKAQGTKIRRDFSTSFISVRGE